MDDTLAPPVTDFKRLLGNVLQQHGRIVSLTLLNQKGVFRKPNNGISGKALMLKVCNIDFKTVYYPWYRFCFILIMGAIYTYGILL